MQFYSLILGALCAWRVTHFLNAEDGPWDIVVRLRRRAGDGFWAKLMDCFYCLSFWTAAPFAFLLGENWKDRGLLWLAFSAGASLLQRATDRGSSEAAATYVEEKEN